MEGEDRLGKQEDSECRDRLGQEICQILRETGLVEKTFSAKGREFLLVDAAAEYLEARGKDNTTDMDDIADRIP